MPTRIGPSPGAPVIDIKPAHALGDLVEAGALLVGAVLPEPGNAAIDDSRVDLADARVTDAQLVFDVGAEILDHHVGLFYQPHEGLDPLGVLQVERHRPLVAVQVLEVRAAARAAELLAGILQQGVDLDDISAPVRELTRAGRTGPDAGEVEHGETGEGLRGARDRHQRAPVRSAQRGGNGARTIAESWPLSCDRMHVG